MRRARDTPDPTGALGETRRVVGWGLACWALAQLAMAVLSRNATALVAAQAAIAEWGAGRVGVSWSAPAEPPASGGAIARRAGVGAGLGAAAAAVAVVVAVVTGQASLAHASPSAASLAVALVVATLGAVRDELFFRGWVLRATRAAWPGPRGLVASVATCALAGLAGRLGTTQAEHWALLPLLVEGLRGAAMACVWIRDRGAWMAVGASATWAWGLGSFVHGGLLDVRFAAEPDAGVPALLVVAVAAGLGAWAIRAPRARAD